MSLRYIHKKNNEFLDWLRFKRVTIVPNLLIIGAQKSGTTSLHSYLNQHPDIHMSNPLKEPGYFLPFESVAKYYKNKGLQFKDRYELLSRHMLRGYSGQVYHGEASTFYTTLSQNEKEGLPQFIKEHSPKAKLIYIVRHPLERIRSHYIHENTRYRFLGNVTQFCKRNPEALGISNYAFHLSQYLKVFDSSEILLLQFSELRDNPKQLLKKVEQFLGLDAFGNYEVTKLNTSDVSEIKPMALKFNPVYFQKIAPELQQQVKTLTELTKVDFSNWTFNQNDWCFIPKKKNQKKGTKLQQKKSKNGNG